MSAKAWVPLRVAVFQGDGEDTTVREARGGRCVGPVENSMANIFIRNPALRFADGLDRHGRGIGRWISFPLVNQRSAHSMTEDAAPGRNIPPNRRR